MARIKRLLRRALYLIAGLGLLGVLGVGVLYWLIAPRLPDVQELRNVELQVPLAIYTRDGKLIALIGETRRFPVDIEEVPLPVKQAFIAAEDKRFREHTGVDMAAIIPKDMDLEVVTAASSGSEKLYEGNARYWDEQLSKGILGQVATTDAIAGGHAVGNIHEKVRDDIRTLSRQLGRVPTDEEIIGFTGLAEKDYQEFLRAESCEAIEGFNAAAGV